MNRRAKGGLALGILVLLGVAVLPMAYRHRHGLHTWLHRIRHGLSGGGSSSAGAGAAELDHTLRINGRTFTDVLGYPPYYLTITQYDVVLFVTRVNDGGSNLIHVLNRKTGQEEQIATRVDFGRNIGAEGGAFRDYVERVESNGVALASMSSAGKPVKTVYQLNLRTAMVDTREVFYYDEDGRITNTEVGPGF